LHGMTPVGKPRRRRSRQLAVRRRAVAMGRGAGASLAILPATRPRVKADSRPAGRESREIRLRRQDVRENRFGIKMPVTKFG
jgi:hypothetical protein